MEWTIKASKCFSKKWGHQWKIELLNPHLWKEIVSELQSSACEEQTFSVAVLSEWELDEIRMQLILVTVFTVIFNENQLWLQQLIKKIPS